MSCYGNFNLVRQELKKVALKFLYKLRKEMGNYFKENNIKLTMKLCDALMSPILFYTMYGGLISMDNIRKGSSRISSK